MSRFILTKYDDEDRLRLQHLVLCLQPEPTYKFVLEVYTPGVRNDVFHVMPHTDMHGGKGDDTFYPMISCCHAPAPVPYREPQQYQRGWSYVNMRESGVEATGMREDVSQILSEVAAAITLYRMIHGDQTPDVRTIPAVGTTPHWVSVKPSGFTVIQFYLEGIASALNSLKATV